VAGVTIHLVRHGETDWNVEGRLQGWTDIPLNATGREQARAAASTFSGRAIGAVISSDLSRARETAAAIAAAVGLEVVTDPALRERNYGVAEGRVSSELNVELGGRLDEHWADPDFAFDGGETRRDAYSRLGTFLADVLASSPEQEIVVVSHGGALRVARGFLEGVPVERLPSWSPANAEITTVVSAQQKSV
jgi:broad specificity phosphatase PhoE